jgi:tetrahydrodipicolinate N-succinyltransferase
MPKSISDIVHNIVRTIFHPEPSTKSIVRVGGTPGVKMSKTYNTSSKHKDKYKDKRSKKNKFKGGSKKDMSAPPEVHAPKGIRRVVVFRGSLTDAFIEQYTETFGSDFAFNFAFLDEVTDDAKCRFNRVNVHRLDQSVFFPLGLSEHFDNSYNSLVYEKDTHKEYLLASLRNWQGFSNSLIHKSVERSRSKKDMFVYEDSVWVMPHCVIGDRTWLGQGVVVCHASRIYSDCIIEPFCWISPGARIYGRSIIGESSFIGAGAIICANVSVGEGSYISTGAYLSQSVPPGAVVLEGVNNIRPSLKAEDCFSRFYCKRRVNPLLVSV